MLNPVQFTGALAQGVAEKRAAVAKPVTFGTDAFRRTASKPVQIVASLGPASTSPEVIEQLILAGTDVFRIDFAKGTHEEHGQTINRIRTVSDLLEKSGQIRRPVRIMADLQGPRIAVGDYQAGPTDLAKDDVVKLSADATSAAKDVIPVTYPDLIPALSPGNRLIVNDGTLILEVTEAASPENGNQAVCKVVKPGKLSANLMMNVPDAQLKTPALTDKDKADLQFALDSGVDIITESYPATDSDVLETRGLIQAHDGQSGRKTTLIAKIERPISVEPEMLKAITKAADGVMVARGDLGTEMGIDQLPALQKRIINSAKEGKKFVVVANKLLGSMINSDQPSRSDVFDMVQAIQDKADYVMLTGETATGKYPVEAVKLADKLIRQYYPKAEKPAIDTSDPVKAAIAQLRNFVHQLIDSLFDRAAAWAQDVKQALPEKARTLIFGKGKNTRKQGTGQAQP